MNTATNFVAHRTSEVSGWTRNSNNKQPFFCPGWLKFWFESRSTVKFTQRSRSTSQRTINFCSLLAGTTWSFGPCYLNFQLFFIVAQSQLTSIYNFGSIYTIVLTHEYFMVFYRDIMGNIIPLGNYMHDSIRKWCLCVWASEIYQMRVSHAKSLRVGRSEQTNYSWIQDWSNDDI